MKYALKRDQAFVDHGFTKEELPLHKKNFSRPNLTPKKETKLQDIEKLISIEDVSDVVSHIFKREEIEHNSPCSLPLSHNFHSENNYTHAISRKSVWPESFSHQEDYYRRDRYEAEPGLQLYDCIKPQSGYNSGFFMQQEQPLLCNIGVSKYEKTKLRERVDESKMHHMEFTQVGYQLKKHVSTAEPNEELEREIRHRRWRNICKTPEPRPDSKLIKTIKSSFSKCSTKIKNIIRLQ